MRTSFDLPSPSPTANPSRKKHHRDTVGYLVLLGENDFDNDCPVFFGWYPRKINGPADLLARVQFGFPGKLKYIGHQMGTLQDVTDLCKMLRLAKMRGSTGWFFRCEHVDRILANLPTYPVDEELSEELPRRKPAAKAKPARARSSRLKTYVGVSKLQPRSKKKATRR